jgi:hypothetical protein
MFLPVLPGLPIHREYGGFPGRSARRSFVVEQLKGWRRGFEASPRVGIEEQLQALDFRLAVMMVCTGLATSTNATALPMRTASGHSVVSG